MLTLGIDCGITRANPAGIALVETDPLSLVGAHTFVAGAGEWDERLYVFSQYLADLIRKLKPALISYEYPHLERNPQTLIKLAHVGGVVIASGAAHGLPVVKVHPSQAKTALAGSPTATKRDMIRAVETIFRQRLPKDAADALGVALAGEAIYRRAALTAR